MAQIEIPIFIRRHNGRYLYTPFEVVKVPIGSSVIWTVNDDSDFQMILKRDFFWRFEIYFPDESPFEWRERESTSFSGKFQRPDKFKITEGVTRSEGDFKYGVKLVDHIGSNVVDEEDPRLIVFS